MNEFVFGIIVCIIIFYLSWAYGKKQNNTRNEILYTLAKELKLEVKGYTKPQLGGLASNTRYTIIQGKYKNRLIQVKISNYLEGNRTLAESLSVSWFARIITWFRVQEFLQIVIYLNKKYPLKNISSNMYIYENKLIYVFPATLYMTNDFRFPTKEKIMKVIDTSINIAKNYDQR